MSEISEQLPEQSSEISEQSDLVWGGEKISKIIGRTRRVTFSLLEKGEIPAKKVGNRWVSRRSKLIAFLSGEEA